MKHVDDNLISFTGDAAGNIWRNELILFPAGGSRTGTREWVERDIVLPAGRRIDDVLKFSGVQRFKLTVHGVVPGGAEDVADFNNGCRDVELYAPDGFAPAGEYGFTVKGACRRIRIRGKLLGHGRTVDVDLGNHSDQKTGTTSGVELELQSADGRPVTWRGLNATTPRLVGPGPYRCIGRVPGMWRHLFGQVFALIKRLFG